MEPFDIPSEKNEINPFREKIVEDKKPNLLHYFVRYFAVKKPVDSEMEEGEEFNQKQGLNNARNSVPCGLWSEIFLTLDLNSILQMSQTNKFFSDNIKKDNHLWKNLIAKYLTENPRFNLGETPYQYFMRQNTAVKELKKLNVNDKKKILLGIAELSLDQLFVIVSQKNPRFLSLFDRLINSKFIGSNYYMNIAAKINNVIILQHILDNGGKALLSTPQSHFNGGVAIASCSFGIFHTAAKYNSVDCLELIYSNFQGGDFDNINSIDVYGYTALHHAASNGHKESLKFLIENNSDIDFQTHDSSKNTGLHLAAKEGHLECVKFLVTHKAKLDCLNKDDEIPYQLALEKMHADCANYLREEMVRQNIPIPDSYESFMP